MVINVGDKISLTWDGPEHEGPYSATVTITAIDEVRKEITGIQ
jgi:hypothetical protein